MPQAVTLASIDTALSLKQRLPFARLPLQQTVAANSVNFNAPTLALNALNRDVFTRQTVHLARLHFGFDSKDKNIPVVSNLAALKQQLIDAPNQEARYKIGRPFLEQFNEYGAIYVENHAVDPAVVSQAWRVIPEILGKPLETLKPYVTNEIAQLRGLQIKPGDPKRLFVVGQHHNIKMKGFEKLTDTGLNLMNELNKVKQDIVDILGLIYEGKTNGFLGRYLTGQDTVNSSTLRELYYPDQKQLKDDVVPLQGDKNLENHFVRLKAHLDYGFITLIPASNEQGLYVLPNSVAQKHNVQTMEDALKIPLNQWIKAKPQDNQILVQIGRQGMIATQSFAQSGKPQNNHQPLPLMATWHMVLADDDELQSGRSSAALFVENDNDPLPDIKGSLSAAQHITALYQAPDEEEPTPVVNLYDLFLRTWRSENNPKRFKPDTTIPYTVEELAALYNENALPDIVAKKSKYLTYGA